MHLAGPPAGMVGVEVMLPHSLALEHMCLWQEVLTTVRSKN